MKGTRAKDMREAWVDWPAQAGPRPSYRELKRRWKTRHDRPVAWRGRKPHGRPATPNLALWRQVWAGQLTPEAAVAALVQALGLDQAKQTATMRRLLRMIAAQELRRSFGLS